MFHTFKPYIREQGEDTPGKHILYRVTPAEIALADAQMPMPAELRKFYLEIGYGFFHRGSGSFNRLLSPLQCKQLNLKEDFYAHDPEVDSYLDRYKGNKCLFMEVNEGIYLAMDNLDIQGKNAVYLFDQKMADSLADFLLQFDQDPGLLEI